MTYPAPSLPPQEPQQEPAPEQPRARWGLLLLGLAAFFVAPFFPVALPSFMPIGDTMAFVVAALAVCTVVGWWRGGSGLLALAWVGLAAWMVSIPWHAALGQPIDAYGQLAYGWVVLVVAAFGVVSLVAPMYGYFARAMTAIGIAFVGAFMLAAAMPDGIATVQQVAVEASIRHTEQIIAVWEQISRWPIWPAAFGEVFTKNEVLFRQGTEQVGTLLPALLALESLIALALGWALYHRLSTVPAGPPFGPLREFRFNDQLIWGLAVGATLFFLPAFADGRGAGLNLLLFFGALYLLRGIGVLSWVTHRRGIAIGLILLIAVAPLVAAALALGVGVGDTWMDWRKRVTPAT